MLSVLLKPRKRFGQHFLVDETTLDRIHDVLALQPEHHILEIGPGRGELTADILQATNNVVAIEIDRDLIRYLRERYPRLEVVQGDILEVDASMFRARRVVGNVPYNVSTPLLLRLASIVDCVDVHLMLQKEVVDRIAAIPRTKAWGRLSIKVQRLFDVLPLFVVDPSAFEPPPKVLSVFVRLTYKPSPLVVQDPVMFDTILRHAFSQRRKTLENSLRSFQVNWERVGVNPSLRGDQLTVAEYVSIADSASS